MRNVIAYSHTHGPRVVPNDLAVDPLSEYDDREPSTVTTEDGFAWDEMVGFAALGREDLAHLPLWTIEDMEAFRDQDTP